ncbi:MAG: nucleoside deaminase [Chloracidobacterium sp.]|nr:nucleoside deaminase [Chloracidobacterium sp.]
MPDIDESWMWRAIGMAREAEKIGEVPVGAVLVGPDGKILAAAGNRTIKDIDPTGHAEIRALRIAATRVGNYRLIGTTMYATVEPCAMCAGALVNARVARLVFGAPDERFGAVRSIFQVCDNEKLNHRLAVEGGVLEENCRRLMQDFFKARRK